MIIIVVYGPQVYRKIKKRQKERVGGVDDDDDEGNERTEVAARKRAEERMSLRHKVRRCGG